MKKIFFLILIPVFIFTSCKDSVYRVGRPVLGTVVNITVISSKGKAAEASEDVFNEFKRIETEMSPFKKSSDVYRINNSVPKSRLSISNETFSLIEQSVNISDDTYGCFDITFESIAHLWNYKNKKFIPPSRNRVRKILSLVNYRNINLFPDEKALSLAKKGMKISLGGIAKGYAIKRGISILKEKGIKSGIVDAGGDLQVIGEKFGEKWKTGLMHPRKKSLLLSIDMEDMDTIATSGDYERFVMYRGKRYHHIIDPHTGSPTHTFSSVSVISKDPVISDSYATAIFVMGYERAVKFIDEHPEIKIILIDLKNKVFVSKSLKDRITLLEDVTVKWF